jgi:protein TonB
MSDEDKFGKGFLDELESLSNGSEKKLKKTGSAEEVENLLKTTLSEVGIDAEKLRASVKAMEVEKKKEQEEIARLDSILEPVRKPHDTASGTLHGTSHKPLTETHHETVPEAPHPPLREAPKEKEKEKAKEHFAPRTGERVEIFEKPKPTEKDVFPPLPEKKPGAVRPAPPIKRERLETPAKKTEGVLFDSYADKPKKKFPVAAVILAAVVVVGGASAAFLFLKPGGGTSTPAATSLAAQKPAVQPAEPADLTGGEEQPPSTPAEDGSLTASNPDAKTLAAANRRGGASGPAAKPGGGTPSVTVQTGPAPERQGAPSEPIQPLVPVQNPTVQEVKPAVTQASAADSNAAPVRTTPAAQPQAPQPKRAKLGDLVALEQVDTQPVALEKVEAIYPALALRFGLEGTVVVNALISETGDVIRTTVIRKITTSGNYGFEDASEEAVKKWKFRPAVKDGVKVKTWMPVAVVFKK